jgi:hypothetical protein
VGLPAKSVAQGIELQCRHGPDSDVYFKVPNNGGYETTSRIEYDFVKNPDLGKVYPGGRRAALLDPVLVAHAAKRDDGGELLDMPLEAHALAKVAEKNNCSPEDMLNSIKYILLRKGKEAYMGGLALSRAFNGLERKSKKVGAGGADAADTRMLEGLKKLADLGDHKLKEARKAVKVALREAKRIEKTGWGSFDDVAQRVQSAVKYVSQEMLEVLVLLARRNLAQAKVTEEELTGLRLYTGAYTD